MRPVNVYIFLFCFLFFSDVFAQREFIRMSSQVNHPAYNNYFPFISGDGLSLIYVNDYADYGQLSMHMTNKTGGLWRKGEEMPRHVNRPDLNFLGGYSLNFDGNFLIVTSRKHGLGGYELWYSEKKNGNWSELRNFGAPVNSAMHDASGVLTPDEQEMYFMRCKQMDETTASGCKIYYTHKRFDRWTDPEPLPENVNSYHPQMPRILGDGETLIFTSDKAGGKGGFDFYVTKKTADGWSDPQNLSFASTANDDKYASTPAKGRYLYVSRPGERKSEIVQLLIPEEFRPKSVYKITGKIFFPDNAPFPVEGIVFDAKNRKTFSRFTVDNTGNFAIALPEGTTYDVSLNPKTKNYWYYSKLYPLDSVPNRDRESIKVEFQEIKPDIPIVMESLLFERYSATLNDVSSFELRRLSTLLKANPSFQLEIQNHFYNYQEDSVQHLNPDLTEIRRDTSYVKIEKFIPAHYLSTTLQDTIWLDSLSTNGKVIANKTDTLMMMINADSIHLQNTDYKVTVPALQPVIKTTFHNDRTLQEAEAIKEALVSRGISSERIITTAKVHKEEVRNKKEREIILIIKKE